MKARLAGIMVALALSGCITDPKIETTEPWEGHYFTVEEAQQGAKSIQLRDGESVWMMSNKTLNRLLKYARK